MDLKEILETARTTVRIAKREGTLEQLTKAIVRRKVEEILSIEEGLLDEHEYKKAVSKVVQDTIDEEALDDTNGLNVKQSDCSNSKTSKKRKASETRQLQSNEPNLKHEQNEGTNHRGRSSLISVSNLDKRSCSRSATLDLAEQSDSELSVLIDESPKRKKMKQKVKEKKSEKSKAPSRQSKPKNSATSLSPDEEQVKRLKALIVACGVRKVWAKELQGLDTPSRQISHLRILLTELGMKGRFSMEQAKAIKEKRELEKEMADVREFAENFVGTGRPSRSKDAKPQERMSVDDDSDADNDSPNGTKPRRPGNAHRSILAFLGDQSDSE